MGKGKSDLKPVQTANEGPVQARTGQSQELKRELSFFDVTNMVVGAIVGSDIYIASAITAGLIGPFSIIVWVIDAVIATILAMVFAYCSYHIPRVGGSFAYVSTALDDFYGFLAGWSLWIAEVLSLPVFAITFSNYLQYFVQLNFLGQTLIKLVFVFSITYVNIRGVKKAGVLNDILTFIKLLPLFVMVAGGLFTLVRNPSLLSNYSPFLPFGLSDFGSALVLIFWAYVGFELAPLPASEIKEPGKVLPKAIIIGMIVVTLFYLTTNFVAYAMVNSSELAKTSTPLILVGTALFGIFGAIMMSAGALFSVSGSDESAVLGTSRLAYAMSIDGLFPAIFAWTHPKYKTPYMSLLIQGIIAFILSIFSGIKGLISFAVLNLAFSYLLTCISLIVLEKKKGKLPGETFMPWAGIIICLYLLYATTLFDKIVGLSLILLGIPIYAYFSPKTDVSHLKELFVSEEAVMLRAMERQNNFLAYAIRRLHRLLVRKY